jgi:hypothetical protein
MHIIFYSYLKIVKNLTYVVLNINRLLLDCMELQELSKKSKLGLIFNNRRDSDYVVL